MPNVVKIVKGVAKAVTKKKAVAANKKGLTAANKGSMAPKGYKTDAARRAATLRDKQIGAKGYKGMTDSEMSELGRLSSIIKGPAPKNVISKSGRKANAASIKSKAAATIASARAKKK
jgi:hypothetical protein